MSDRPTVRSASNGFQDHEDSRVGKGAGGRRWWGSDRCKNFVGAYKANVVPTSPTAPDGQSDVVILAPHWTDAELRVRPTAQKPRLRGTMRFMQWMLDLRDDGTGSGSNSWHISVEYLMNGEDNRHSWDLFPCPHGSWMIEPRHITDADLPLQRRLFLGRRLSCANLALRFTRSGTGSRKLAVRYLGTHGGL